MVVERNHDAGGGRSIRSTMALDGGCRECRRGLDARRLPRRSRRRRRRRPCARIALPREIPGTVAFVGLEVVAFRPLVPCVDEEQALVAVVTELRLPERELRPVA